MDMKELAKAFEDEPKGSKKSKEPEELKDRGEAEKKTDRKTTKKVKEEKTEKKRVLPIATLLVGLAVLIAGAAFLAVKLIQYSNVNDAERLVELGTFVEDDEESVIWQFTEIGKGTLTTNNHTNDYDFIWAIENGKLKIETAWLYDLNDEFDYKIDGDKLILNDEIILRTR